MLWRRLPETDPVSPPPPWLASTEIRMENWIPRNLKSCCTTRPRGPFSGEIRDTSQDSTRLPPASRKRISISCGIPKPRRIQPVPAPTLHQFLPNENESDLIPIGSGL